MDFKSRLIQGCVLIFLLGTLYGGCYNFYLCYLGFLGDLKGEFFLFCTMYSFSIVANLLFIYIVLFKVREKS